MIVALAAAEPGRDVEVVAHQIAVVCFDDTAKVNADAKIEALGRRCAGVAFDHRLELKWRNVPT
jgi:intracellular sulfur oxidation DsrE/DsrF family protein